MKRKKTDYVFKKYEIFDLIENEFYKNYGYTILPEGIPAIIKGFNELNISDNPTIQDLIDLYNLIENELFKIKL